LATSMIIVYFTTLLGPEVFVINFGDLNEAYLFSPLTFPDGSGISLNEAKTLTMLMVTIFICESFLVLQIRRPNKSLILSIKEDSTRFMYGLIAFLFLLLIALIYIPGVQVTLADWGLNFRFMFLTGLDWLVCFLISLICIVSFEFVKYMARRHEIYF